MSGRAPTGPTPEPSVTLATRVRRSLRQRVRVYCVEQGMPMQDFITEALREYLAARERTQGRRGHAG